MKEAVALAKEADAKKGVSPTKSDNSILRVRDEPERQLGSLRDVIGNIRRDGDKPSVESIAAELSNMHTTQRAPALLALQQTHGNRYVQRVVALAKKGNGETEVALDVEQAIQRARGGGQTMDKSMRGQMESAFGADFSGVRVHTDTEADTLNRMLNARAFTTCQDIFFRQGEYNPSSSSGLKLMAHELTHVVQQNDDKVQRKLTVGQPGDRYEQEADRVAKQVSSMQLRGETQEREHTHKDHTDSIVPPYLGSIMTGGQANPAQYKVALRTFRREHRNEALDLHRSKMSESSSSILITLTSPQQQVRRFDPGPPRRAFCFIAANTGFYNTVWAANREEARGRFWGNHFCHDGACNNEGVNIWQVETYEEGCVSE